MERTSCPEAVIVVLDTLLRAQKPYTISHLSKETGLNRRTVKKTLDLLAETQKRLQDKTLDVTKLGQTTMIQLTERGGLLNLPEELQNLIIRTAYYPAPSRDEEILVFLYREKAFSPESAFILDSSALVKKLVEQGQLIGTTKEGKRAYYLSDEGKIVSRGTLKLYPELESVKL
jgi:predicted transcriptional regulator